MRRSVLIIAVAGGLLVATADKGATAGPLTAGAQTLSLRGGRGVAVVSAHGAVLGSLRRGRLVVTIPRGSHAVAAVFGAEVRRKLGARRTLYRGHGIRYRVFRGAWRLRIEGRGVNASAAARGTFGLAGGRGFFSVADRPYRHWPTVYRRFRLRG
jgi:hypothetical protein